MGYHYQTKTQREEAYVNSHAAFVDRTINSREFRLGTLSYVRTGHIPHDHFWAALAKQEQHDPSKFFAHHLQYVGFFTAPAKLGELPKDNVIFDVMKDRDIHQHAIFAAHHPFYVGLVDRDLRLEAESTTNLVVSPRTLDPWPVCQDLSPTHPIVWPILSVPSPISGTPTGPVIPVLTTTSSPTPSPKPAPSGSSSNGSGPVPEPASILMVAVGLLAAFSARRFYKNL